jgi:hypothetical protein
MDCLNFNIPQVQKDFNELTKIFDSKNIAYALLSKNNGYNLDYTTKGYESKLFQSLLNLEGIKGNRELALKTKSIIYTKEFQRWSKEEPTIKNSMFFNSEGETRPIHLPSNNLFSDTSVLGKFNITTKPITPTKNNLTGTALKFLNKLGEGNVTKILDESLATINNPKFVKGMDRVIKMLENSNTFEDNGIFMHKDDKYIMHLNANLFEDIVDEQKLVNNMGERMKIWNNKNGLAKHNVIGPKDSNTGNRFVIVTDEQYGETWDDLSNPTRKQAIFESNMARIEWANKKFISITGKPGIIVKEKSVKGLNHTIGFVTIDNEVLKEYNDIKYNQYLNSMKIYMSLGSEISEDLDFSTLQHKLKEERSQVKRDKAVLESVGGKQIEINKLDNKIEDLNSRIDNILKDGELVDIYNEAEKNLIDVKELLNSNKLNASQFNFALSKLNMWISAGDFSQRSHMFLDAEMVESPEIQQKFAELKMRAELMLPELLAKGEVIISNGVNDEFGTQLTYDKIVSLPHKIGAWFKNTLSLNRAGQALAQYVSKIVTEANDEAHREVITKSRDLAILFKKVVDKGFNKRLFYQMEDIVIGGKTYQEETGRMVHKFSQAYFVTKGRYGFNISFRKNNQIMIDPTKLNDPKYITELEKHLGKIGIKEYVDRAKALYENYEKIEADHISIEYGDNELTNEQKADLAIWRKQNSPLERIKAINEAKSGLLSEVTGKDTFLIVIPKRFDKSGKDYGYYDKNFEQIENDADTYSLYKEAHDITKNSQKLYGHSDLSSTSLAFVKSGMLAKLNKVGTANFLTKELYNEMVGNLEGGGPKSDKIDPITKKPVKTLQLGVQTIDGMIKDLRAKKRLEKQIELGRELTEDERNLIRVEASKEVFDKMDFDADNTLFKSLNMLNLAALSFKHSSMIEDMVNIALTYLLKSTVNTGNEIIDTQGNTVGQEYITNLQEMVDHFLKVTYYKEPKGDTSHSLLHVETKTDKERRIELEKLLAKKDITDEQKIYVENELQSLGGNVTVNSLFRNLMGFMRLKGMGWNIPAGIANLAFGKITNMYKAAEGRLYNMSDWIKAEKSLFTEWSKFNKVIENYHIIGDILYEFKESAKFDTGKNWFQKVTKSIKPYALQVATEKQNQGTVMIAMMVHQKVTNAKGETKSLWEAINENGVLSDEWFIENKSGDLAVKSIVSRIKDTVAEIHGEYNRTIMLQNTTAGQAVAMFRKWFFEAFHARFGVEKPDYNRGIITKGRYRTWYELTKKFKLNPRALYRAYKNNELSEVDRVNIRVNIVELTTVVFTYALYAILKKGICGDDKTCKDSNIVQLSVMNMMQKINKDIQFYYNPKAWSDFIKNPTAMTGLLDDMFKLYSLSTLEMFGEEEDMIYAQGRHKGEDKFNVFVKTQIPFVNSMEKAKVYGDELIQIK